MSKDSETSLGTVTDESPKLTSSNVLFSQASLKPNHTSLQSHKTKKRKYLRKIFTQLYTLTFVKNNLTTLYNLPQLIPFCVFPPFQRISSAGHAVMNIKNKTINAIQHK